MTLQSTSFWDFSNQLYDRDGISQICLQLQAEFGLDVNLLLFCYWAANFDEMPSEPEWNKILEFSTAWKNNIVQPLRNARNSLKSEFVSHNDDPKYTVLRERIKLDELAAEKLQQEFIQSCTTIAESQDSQHFSTAKALSNVSYLFSKLGIKITEEIIKKLETISAKIS